MNVSFAQVLISNKAIIVDEYVYRQTNTLKNGDIVDMYVALTRSVTSLFPRHVCGHLFQTVIVLEQITDLKVFMVMRISMHCSMPDIIIYSFS